MMLVLIASSDSEKYVREAVIELIQKKQQSCLSLLFCANQVVIAQWLVWQLATGKVPGSNPGKGDNLLISD